MYISNPTTTLSSSSCCYKNLYAAKLSAFVFGTYSGTFASTCAASTNNVTDNTPSTLFTPSSCANDQYFDTTTSTCISKFIIMVIFNLK